MKYLAPLIIALSLSCAKSKNEPLIPEKKKDRKEIQSVSVYDYTKYGLPLYEDINNTKSKITNIKTGERVVFLDQIEADTTKNRDYCKVRLSDGTEGWALNLYIVKNAFPGAILNPTPVFERPDILTKSLSKQYKNMDLVAVAEEKGDWYKVIGRNNQNIGWVKKSAVITNDEDIASVALARKELFDKEGNIDFDKVEEFINKLPFKNSSVPSLLEQQHEEYERQRRRDERDRDRDD